MYTHMRTHTFARAHTHTHIHTHVHAGSFASVYEGMHVETRELVAIKKVCQPVWHQCHVTPVSHQSWRAFAILPHHMYMCVCVPKCVCVCVCVCVYI